MTDMKRILFITVIIYLLTSVCTVNAIHGSSHVKFYAFYEYYCAGCALELKPLLNEYGEDKVLIFDIREGNNSGRYAKITNLIGYLDLPVVGVFKNNSLTAIVSGFFEEDDWRKIVETEYDGVPVYAKRNIKPIKIIKDEETINLISRIFIKGETIAVKDTGIHIPSFLPIILTAAAIDAVNPCEFYVLTVLLSLVFISKRKKDILKIGLAFAIGIFIAYYLMGFGLIKLIAYSTTARYAVAILGLTIGVRIIINLVFGIFGISIGLREVLGNILGKKFKRVPKVFSKKMSVYLRKASSNPISAFSVGVLSASFLSPCTSGPYFIALSLIADLRSAMLGILLLTIYNVIFITPLIAITLGVYTLKLTTRGLKQWSSRERRWLDLAAGILMIALSIYLIFYYIPLGSMYT